MSRNNGKKKQLHFASASCLICERDVEPCYVCKEEKMARMDQCSFCGQGPFCDDCYASPDFEGMKNSKRNVKKWKPYDVCPICAQFLEHSPCNQGDECDSKKKGIPCLRPLHHVHSALVPAPDKQTKKLKAETKD